MCLRQITLAASVFAWTTGIGLTADMDARTTNAAGTSTVTQVADEYVKLLNELDRAVPIDSAEILGAARDLFLHYDLLLGQLEKAAPVLPHGADASSIVHANTRWIRKRDVVPVVYILGETSNRIDTAKRWSEFAIRRERQLLSATRREVKRCNLVELRRAYIGFHVGLAARQVAMRQLWLLASGRARVVWRNRYTGRVTPTDPNTSWRYVVRSAAFAKSPIYVRPPRKSKPCEFYCVHRLKTLQRQKECLDRLAVLIRVELETLASEHLGQVESVLKHGKETDRVLAVSSLGWWNGRDGLRLIDQSVRDQEPIRNAGLIALSRCQHTRTTMMSLADHDDLQVRLLAAELAEGHIQDIDTAIYITKKLMQDRTREVRTAAYTRFERLASICNASMMDLLGEMKSVLRSRDSNVILDAVNWIDLYGANAHESVVDAKRQLLMPLMRHREEIVRSAAKKSLTHLHFAVAH